MTEQPIITIFCAFTRRWRVEQWLSDLQKVQHDKTRTNLAFIVDCNDNWIVKRLERFAKEEGYRNSIVVSNPDNSPHPMDIGIRRLRIADIKNQSKYLVNQMDGELILSLEDDTVFGHLPNFERLYKPFESYQWLGFVQGVQAGRWQVKMLGVWQFNGVLAPDKAYTMLPNFTNENDYQNISAGGFYCYMTRRHLYVNHDYYWSSAQPWGPDVNYGQWLRLQGYAVQVDWRTKLGHATQTATIWPDDNLSQIVYTKDTNTGMWGRHDTDKTN